MTVDESQQGAAARGAAGSFLVVCVGFFTLAAQALLFRDFLTAFEGSELAIGMFFSLWLLWIGTGAISARTLLRGLARWRYFELLPLLYIPAFMFAHMLLIDARLICGIEAWETFPFIRLLPIAAAALVPVSFLTGMIFTLACEWKKGRHDLPVATVYMLEVAGSFAGGILVTLTLWQGMRVETIFILSALVLSLGSAAPAVADRRLPFALAVSIIALALVAIGLDRQWAEKHNRALWAQLLEKEGYGGSFTTPHSRYSYGRRRGQFVIISRRSVVEAIPDLERASVVAAMALAQRPEAQRFLVAGDAVYPLCRRLLELPSVRKVTWLHGDPDYTARAMEIMPDELRTDSPRLDIPHLDVRAHVRAPNLKYDVAILAFSDPETLHANRYYTRDFFMDLKNALGPKGVACINISGGENYLGTELVRMGASVYHTLEKAFGHVAIKGGERTWFFASAVGGLSESPGELAGRFSRVKRGAEICPPQVFETMFVPERIDAQRSLYLGEIERLGEDRLLNSDTRPRALSFALQAAARREHVGHVSRFIDFFTRAGAWIIAGGLGLYLILRLLYRFRTLPRREGGFHRISGIDTAVLVFTAGAAGMGLNIVLMCRLEAAYGSIFLLVGLVAALFMLGMAAGTFTAGRLFARANGPVVPMTAWMAGHLVVLAICAKLPAEPSMAVLCVMFFLGGFFSAGYVALAARIMTEESRGLTSAGGSIELCDHVGGAIGGAVVGLCTIPVMGAGATLVLIGALMAVNLAALLPVERAHRKPPPRAIRRLCAAGYLFFAAAAFLLLSSHVLMAYEIPDPQGADRDDLESVYRQLMGSGELELKRDVTDDAVEFEYLEISGSPFCEKGYFFTTRNLAGRVYGYRGPIILALLVDREGVVKRAGIIEASEDRPYLVGVLNWLPYALEGRNIFGPDALEDVDIVTGATVSCNTVLYAADKAGSRFATAVLGTSAYRAGSDAGVEWKNCLPWLLFTLLLVGAVAMRRFPSRPGRAVFLVVVLILFGAVMNLQYSSREVMSLSGLDLELTALTGPLLLILAVPVAVLLFGNVYCGWLCPFGAVQELAGELRPKSASLDPPAPVARYARFIKYLLLFILVAVFAFTRETALCESDPLMTAFAFMYTSGAVWILIGLIVVMSFFSRRFWCRYLCPAGAFLSILNIARIIRPLAPRVSPGRCDMGLERADELDCICCDRCRRGENPRRQPGGAWRPAVLVAAVVCSLALLAWDVSSRSVRAGGAERRPSDAEIVIPPDEREHKYVDRDRLRRMIREGRLSGREAMYYRRIESGDKTVEEEREKGYSSNRK